MGVIQQLVWSLITTTALVSLVVLVALNSSEDGMTQAQVNIKQRSLVYVAEKTTISHQFREQLRRYGTSKLYEIFKPKFSAEQKSSLMVALKSLTDALTSAGIPYFLYGGTLIGSWRHHDVIPWDDDIDIIVNISQWQELESVVVPGHSLNTHTLNRYKFYSENATDIPGFFWKYPYIDICFFGDNGSHIFDMDPTYSKTFVYPKEDIFPLAKRPLGDLVLSVPKRTAKVLSQNYDVDLCQTGSYNHQTQKDVSKQNVTTVDCSVLHRIFPFVRRTSNPSWEYLYLNQKLLNTVQLDA